MQARRKTAGRIRITRNVAVRSREARSATITTIATATATAATTAVVTAEAVVMVEAEARREADTRVAVRVADRLAVYDF